MEYFIGKYWAIILYPGPSPKLIILVLVPRLPKRVKDWYSEMIDYNKGMIRLEI